MKYKEEYKMSILQAVNIKKIYKSRMGSNQIEALSSINFSVESGEFVAIMGESGSGKSTMLNILAALDTPTSGEVFLDGINFSNIKEKERAAFRRNNLGFVFQDFNLLDTFTLEDNILLPLVLSQTGYDEMQTRLQPIAKSLGILELLKKYPYEVSGGQKQRAAVARALITNPKLLLADEPTGALDSKSAQLLLETMTKMNEQLHATILMVTHDAFSASYAQRILFLKDGNLFKELSAQGKSRREFYNEILNVLVLLGGETNGAY